LTTTLNFKRGIDLPTWRQRAYMPVATAAGTSIAADNRHNEDRDPHIYFLQAATVFWKYNFKTNEWINLASPALTPALAAGGDSIFVPHTGPSGTLAAGGTTTSVVLTTALPAAVAVNQLANRGDGTGYKIRIVGKSAGGSGKTEERYIVGNTAGTTPTIYLDSALSFTPASTDGYEILSGKVYLLTAGAMASGSFRSYDVATNSFATLAQANLPATIATDSHLVNYSELYVPLSKTPGTDGILGQITATASGATSITGSVAGADATLAANEYRNFQIRIVEDTGAPTAVGQRRNITSHTGPGSSPVYTVPAWSVTPSANAKFVIEGNGDRIICFTTANGNNYNYSISGNAWDVSTTWAVRGANMGAGCSGDFAHGAERDTKGNFRHSQLFSIRGGNVATIDILDIAGATTGSWSLDIAYGNKGLTAFTTGTSGAYNPACCYGRYLYINLNGTQRNLRFDMVNRVLEPYGYLEFVQGTAVVGRRTITIPYVDGTTRLVSLYLQGMARQELFEMAIV
jgi:hypothetical protein